MILEGPHYLFHVPDGAVDLREYHRQDPVTLHVPSSEHGGEYELEAVLAAENDVTWYTAQLCVPFKEMVPAREVGMEDESVLLGADADGRRPAPPALEPRIGAGTVLSVASIGEPGESAQAVLDGLGTGLCNLFCHVFGDERCFGSSGLTTIEEVVAAAEDPTHQWHGLRAFPFRNTPDEARTVYLPNIDAPVAAEEELMECKKLLGICNRIEARKDPVDEHHPRTVVPLVWAEDALGRWTWLNQVRLTQVLSLAREMGGIFNSRGPR